MLEVQRLRMLLIEASDALIAPHDLEAVLPLVHRIQDELGSGGHEDVQWREGNGGEIYGKNGKVELKQWTAVTDDLGIIVREAVPGLFVYELRPRAYATAEEAKAAALYAAERWVSPGGNQIPPVFIGPMGDK
jgi:hypothetical protein